ncbi:hypothetical protein ACX3O0_09180 [Homoserinimonas sp. A447]
MVSDGLLRRPVSLTVWYRLTPWWVRVIAIWVASRIVTTGLLLWLASHQANNAWTDAQPDYFSFASLWDGTWYYVIAVSGYPSELPVTADGHIAENAWAFMPVYPMFVRGLMFVTGFSWHEMAVIVSFAFSLATAIVFYKLMRQVLPEGNSLFAVVLLCVAPLTPITQVAYAESMHAFLLTASLYLLLKRRYWTLFPVVAIMALTRPTGLAFALALALHVGYRWFTRDRDPFPMRQRWASVGLAFFSGLMGLAWLLIAWAVTGSPTAYTDTELAWRAPYIGYQELIPFTAWPQGAAFWFGGALGPIVLGIVAVGFILFMVTPWVRRLGFDLRAWVISYVLYLAAVFFPQSSTFRLLMPIFPLLGALAVPRSRIFRIALVIASVAGQVLWLHWCWWVDGYDWTPP